MNNKNLSIGILSITAVILFIAQFIPVRSARADDAVWKDRDYSILTSRSAKGGDNLYVMDNRTGQVAVFVWDPTSRSFVPGGGILITDAMK